MNSGLIPGAFSDGVVCIDCGGSSWYDLGAFRRCVDCGHQVSTSPSSVLAAVAASEKRAHSSADYDAAERHARIKCAHIDDAATRASSEIDREQSFLAGVRYARGER